MGLKANILANYLGTAVVALAPLLALPWYWSALGPQQYSLVGFVTMLQALMGIVDAGTGQALVREFAGHTPVRGGRRDSALVLLGFERVYWAFGMAMAVAVLLLSKPVASHWLMLEGLPLSTGVQAVCGAGALFAAQFPGSVYRSLLIGINAQVQLNAVMLAGALLRHAGGVLVVHIWPSIPAYLAWHVSIGLLETLARRQLAWHATGVDRSTLRWNFGCLLPFWKTVASLTGAAWLGALTVQIDKVILSKMVSVQQFGYYTIAASLAIGALQLVYPLVQAVMPRAVRLRDDPVGLHRFSIRLLGLFAACVTSGALLFAALGERLLAFWIRDAEAAAMIHPVLSVLLVGTALNALYNVGYIYWLVVDKVDRLLKVNLAALLLSMAIIPPLVLRFGIVGAAFGWLTINMIGFIASLEWLQHGRNRYPPPA